MAAGILLLGALQWEASDGLTVGWKLGWEPIGWRAWLAISAPVMIVSAFIIYGLLRHAGNAPPLNINIVQRMRHQWDSTRVAFRGDGPVGHLRGVGGARHGGRFPAVPGAPLHDTGVGGSTRSRRRRTWR